MSRHFRGRANVFRRMFLIMNVTEMTTASHGAEAPAVPSLSRRELVDELSRIVGTDGVLHKPEDLMVYECDALTLVKREPFVVVLPNDTDQVSRIMRLANQYGIPVVPRGAGTGLSGGALATDQCLMLSLARMNRIESIDLPNRRALVQVGVANLRISQAVAAQGYFYAPDPSSQPACTLGGNIAENSGGPHTLRHGVTTNHILAAEVVLPDGEVVWLGSPVEDTPGYDLLGVIVGSEGTMGIVTRAVVRLCKSPESTKTFLAVFDQMDDAAQAVSNIIAAGIVPVALEMMDSGFIKPVEETYRFGFPLDARAILIIETEGISESTEVETELSAEICRKSGAREIRFARSSEERLLLWKARKGAFAAIGRVATSYCTQDGTVPRSKIPEMLRTIFAVGEKYNLEIANVFHAGDGNMHPVLLFDERDPEMVQRVLEASYEILKACVDLGGTITGEHGIGIEKLGLMDYCFTKPTLEAFADIHQVFNPKNLLNPGKAVPFPGGLGTTEFLLRPPAAM